MPSGKSNGPSTTQLVAGLLVLAAVYQIVYHAFMVRALPDAADFDDHCSVDSKSWQCAEVQIFRNWKTANAERVDAESDVQLEMLVHDKTFLRSTKKSEEVVSTTAPAAQQDTRSAFDKLYDETQAKLEEETSHYKSPFDIDFSELKAHYKAHEQKMHDIHARHHHQHHDSEVVAVQAAGEARMSQFEKLYQDTMAYMEAHENDSTSFADNTAALQSTQEERLKKLQEDHQHHRHSGSSTTTTTLLREQTLAEKIASFGHELCETPEHRRLASCAQFLAPEEIAKADEEAAAHTAERHAMRVADRQRIRDEAMKWEATFAEHDHHFCDDARHKDSSHCKQLHADGKLSFESPPEEPATNAGASTDSKKAFLSASDGDLQWSAVVSAGAKEVTRGESNEGLVSFNQSSLRHLKWSLRGGGKIPKVACVAPIPSSPSARTHMRYFIDNFRLQKYEGEKELILLYQHQDRAIEKLVKEQEGEGIRAVAAFESGEFPSSTAFRFGSWTAHDADVIARWNYDEWYNPERLSLQVRALAVSARPVSLLKYWTVLDGAGKELMSTRGGPGWEGSIVGEAAWMRKHWMPLMEGERALLMDHYRHAIVQVDQPDLLVYNAEAPHAPDMLRHFGLAA